MNDKQRLDFLQSMTTGYGKGWVLRQSTTGRGWRLHESSRPEATTDIREAIDKAAEKIPRTVLVFEGEEHELK